ncbi:MAG: hypothetical protein FWB78_01825 [Treponema sp.]|nr:hypothetical protein [Treponema sp.]
MRRAFGLFGVAMIVAIGLSMTGCASDPDVNRGGWSEYTFLPAGEYVVVGTVIIRNTRRATLLYDLMREALVLGAHDIINVRVGTSYLFGTRIRVVTAVAIRYADAAARN